MLRCGGGDSEWGLVVGSIHTTTRAKVCHQRASEKSDGNCTSHPQSPPRVSSIREYTSAPATTPASETPSLRDDTDRCISQSGTLFWVQTSMPQSAVLYTINVAKWSGSSRRTELQHGRARTVRRPHSLRLHQGRTSASKGSSPASRVRAPQSCSASSPCPPQ